MGGGNFSFNAADLFPGGLSPRGRGKPGERAIKELAMRSIPAWAGETLPIFHFPRKYTVYPRVGGGNIGAGGNGLL